MPRIFSNEAINGFVAKPYAECIASSVELSVAAPYVTHTDELRDAAHAGKAVNLIVGLNCITTPESLRQLIELPAVSLRYFTHRFHAKIYVFDSVAMLGSSNLTDGGLYSNREATIFLDEPSDVDEIRALFNELWESASVLDTDALKRFTEQRLRFGKAVENFDQQIENALGGRAEPHNIAVESKRQKHDRVFIESLKREIETYKPAFLAVMNALSARGLHRSELQDVGPANEANRFLNWVRLTHAPGEDAWRQAPLRSVEGSQELVRVLGEEWITTNASKVPEDYVDWLYTVRATFGSIDAIEGASQAQLSDALLSIHAFNEQLRFVKGGRAQLPVAFWDANKQDVDKTKRTLRFLLFGNGSFVERLYDVLYTPERKLAYFGKFCALELYGTIRPEEYPPIRAIFL